MPFIQLASGSFVDCRGEYPYIENITIEDIAKSLSVQRRFIGHMPARSVLEHCLDVAAAMHRDCCTPYEQLIGLLHDASEAITGDMPGPVKPPAVKELERELQHQILDRLGIKQPNSEVLNRVKCYDLAALRDELYRAQNTHPRWSAWWADQPPGARAIAYTMAQPYSVADFLDTYWRLCR